VWRRVRFNQYQASWKRRSIRTIIRFNQWECTIAAAAAAAVVAVAAAATSHVTQQAMTSLERD